MKNLVKRLLFGAGEAPRTIWFGLGSGCRFIIDPTQKSQRILGIEESEIAGCFRRSIGAARTFIDVGASDGYYPIISMRRNPALVAIGCDAEPSMEQRARANYALTFPNNGPIMEWIPKPIGDREGCVPLDAIADGRAGPILLKIDVDGAEVDVMRSGMRVLSRPDCVVILEVHSAQLEAESIELLKCCGFRCRIIDNAWWRIVVPERRPIALNRWVFAEKVPA